MNVDRLAICNEILATFARGKLVLVNHRVAVQWGGPDPKTIKTKTWMTRGSDFHPTWRYPWGGTQCTAISQLIRWCQGKPVLPMASWEWWGSDKVKLVNPETLAVLRAHGYPEVTPCVLCGQPPQGLDWWNLDGVSGPCCSHTKGCRQGHRA